MSSSRLHDIFSKKERLEREDIERYRQSSDPEFKNRIEQKASSHAFDADSLEGWSALDYDTSVMESLDKRFAPHSNMKWYLIGGTIVILSLLVIMMLNQNTSDESTLSNVETDQTIDRDPSNFGRKPQMTPQIVLDESDISIPSTFERTKSISIAQQVAPGEIVQNFKKMDSSHAHGELLIPVSNLPFLKIDEEQSDYHKLKSIRQQAKEIYLHAFKLVDYRNYRSQPNVSTRQLILNGTPARHETNDSAAFSVDPEPFWKHVEIPYIEYLDKSMKTFSHGEYMSALSHYEKILSTYPTDVNANFYAGICRYNLGEYSVAVTHFDGCIRGPFSNFDEEAQWMKALSYEQLGEDDLMRQLLKKIISEQGFYREQAIEKLGKN